jgi:hypothetical protein
MNRSSAIPLWVALGTFGAFIALGSLLKALGLVSPIASAALEEIH